MVYFSETNLKCKKSPDISTGSKSFLIEKRGDCQGFYFEVQAGRAASGTLAFTFSQEKQDTADIFVRLRLIHGMDSHLKRPTSQLSKIKRDKNGRPMTSSYSANIDLQIAAVKSRKAELLAAKDLARRSLIVKRAELRQEVD